MILLAGLIGIIMLGFILWAVLDIASTAKPQFEAAGVSQTMWLALVLGLTVLCGVPGFVAAMVWHLSINPRLSMFADS